MNLDRRGVTDTAHSQPTIPVYVIHSIDRPFCPFPGCWCQTNQARITQVLLAVREGALLLAEADTLNAEEENEEKTHQSEEKQHEARKYE